MIMILREESKWDQPTPALVWNVFICFSGEILGGFLIANKHPVNAIMVWAE